jgi:hypothetical protein
MVVRALKSKDIILFRFSFQLTMKHNNLLGK